MRPFGSTPSTPTRQRGFSLYFFAAIVVLLALQGIIYLELVGNAVGPFTLFKKQEPPDLSLVRELKVALVRSEATARMFTENPEGYYAAERHWGAILKREGIPYRVVSDSEIAQGLADVTALVLPGAACLGGAQRRALAALLKDGKGLVASGPLGTRDGNCAWQGWDFLSSLAGVRTPTSATPSTTTYVTFRGQQYFSDKLPTGYRIEIPSQELTLAAVERADAYWSDWMLRPAGGSAESALAVHGTSGAGRVAWYGFNPILPVERRVDQELLDGYLISSLLWVGKQPRAVLANWPGARQAAVLVAEEVDQDFTNAEENSRLLKQQGIPAIFVCTSSEAKKNPAAVRSFQSVGEVASAGNSPDPIGGALALQQAGRLREAKHDLEKMTSRKVLGFGPPQGLTDTATVLALNAAGYRYYLNEMAASRAVPEIIEFTESVFFPFQKSEVARIFRTSSDDFEIIANYHGPDPPGPDLAEAFLSDFRRGVDLGGVYTLYFHSYLLGSPKYRPILSAILDNIKGQRVWRTTGQDLVNWWVGRNKIQVQARKVSIHRIQVDVANTGLADLKDASVYVYLPYHPKKFRVSSIIFRLQSPHAQMVENDNVLRLDFAKLRAQTYYTYLVGLDEEVSEK